MANRSIHAAASRSTSTYSGCTMVNDDKTEVEQYVPARTHWPSAHPSPTPDLQAIPLHNLSQNTPATISRPAGQFNHHDNTTNLNANNHLRRISEPGRRSIDTTSTRTLCNSPSPEAPTHPRRSAILIPPPAPVYIPLTNPNTPSMRMDSAIDLTESHMAPYARDRGTGWRRGVFHLRFVIVLLVALGAMGAFAALAILAMKGEANVG